MPEQTDIYISDFPDADGINGTDKVTGLQAGVNKNFSLSSILAWVVNAVRSSFVPTSRTINGKTLDTNVTLTPSDIGAQPTITASGILKGDGSGGVSAAAAGTDYQTPLVAGTDYQTPLVAGTDYATPGMIPAVPSPSDSTPQALGTAAAGSSGAWARGDHVHPSDTGKANQAELATVETGSTASKPYAVGDCFCWNGNLYWAKTAIAAGASFEEGTNCETKTVASLPGAVLVWTNPNMTSSFAAQSINVDLSRFTKVHIVFKADVNDAGMDDAEMIVDGNTHTVARFTLPPSGSSSIGISRGFIPSGSGIDVKEGLSKTLLNGTRSTSNGKVVPLRVYGVF